MLCIYHSILLLCLAEQDLQNSCHCGLALDSRKPSTILLLPLQHHPWQGIPLFAVTINGVFNFCLRKSHDFMLIGILIFLFFTVENSTKQLTDKVF